METPQIITQALSIFKNSSVSEELNTILQKLESRSIEEILNTEKIKEIRQIDNDIRSIVTNVFLSNNLNESAKLIFTEWNYLKRGIENADLKGILIFLSVNCYLHTDIKELLSEEELSEHITQSVADKISTLLQRCNVDIQALPDTPYHEKEMMSKFQQGLIDDDVKSVYDFIEAIERGGRGLHFNFMLEHLIAFLYQINYSCFLQTISKLNNPQSFVFYFQSFKIEKLICLSKENSLTNKWLNFELIRQIIEKEQKENFEENECVGIKNILERITLVDFKFLKQTISYFHRSKLFNASLGELLLTFSNCQIEEIFSDCFFIDKYTNNCEARNNLLERFENKSSEIQMKFMLTTIYEKWDSYYTSLFNVDDFYLNELLLTDFCEFIAMYYINNATEEDITLQMLSIIQQLNWIESEWFSSITKQQTVFHLLFSKFYLLSFSYKERHLKNNDIVDLFLELKQDNILAQRYFEEKMQNIIEKIGSNITPKNIQNEIPE